MTFIAPVPLAGFRGASAILGRKGPSRHDRLRIADEDGARRVLGAEADIPALARAGAAIEHLARIALG